MFLARPQPRNPVSAFSQNYALAGIWMNTLFKKTSDHDAQNWLAVAAIAFEHDHGFRCGLIADRSVSASVGKWGGHDVFCTNSRSSLSSALFQPSV
jgi:hypothetical protein